LGHWVAGDSPVQSSSPRQSPSLGRSGSHRRGLNYEATCKTAASALVVDRYVVLHDSGSSSRPPWSVQGPRPIQQRVDSHLTRSPRGRSESRRSPSPPQLAHRQHRGGYKRAHAHLLQGVSPRRRCTVVSSEPSADQQQQRRQVLHRPRHRSTTDVQLRSCGADATCRRARLPAEA